MAAAAGGLDTHEGKLMRTSGSISMLEAGLIYLVLLLAGVVFSPTAIQAQATIEEELEEVKGLFTFFTGSWDCAGAFADGRSLEADLLFAPELEGRILRYQHADRPPNRYAASATWSLDTDSKQLVSLSVFTIADTTVVSPSLFVASEWTDSSVTFVADTLLSPPFAPHRFRYESEATDRFRMTFEVQRGGSWEMGDYLICRRKK